MRRFGWRVLFFARNAIGLALGLLVGTVMRLGSAVDQWLAGACLIVALVGATIIDWRRP